MPRNTKNSSSNLEQHKPLLEKESRQETKKPFLDFNPRRVTAPSHKPAQLFLFLFIVLVVLFGTMVTSFLFDSTFYVFGLFFFF